MKKLFEKMIFRERPWMWKTALVLALLASFDLRMINLTNPHLDFAPTRHLLSALKVRGTYYQYVSDAPAWQHDAAISLGDTGINEPPVLAFTSAVMIGTLFYHFVVTMFGELDDQPAIKDLLYTQYPICAQTDEYIIFDLQNP